LIGDTLFDPNFLPPEDLERARVSMERCAEGIVIGPEEFQLNRLDGSHVVMECRAYPLSIGENLLVQVIARDVTGRKAAEEERRSLESQLRRSQKMETIGTLAGGIAHDFNNILTPILGYTDMAIRDGEVAGSTRADLEQVIQAAHRAKDLVDQILLFGRQGEEERKPLRLRVILKEALKLLRASLSTAIEIRVTVDEECGPILADASQMHQVLMNLCTNAAHAMKENGGLLEVSLLPVSVDEVLVRTHPSLHPGTYLCLKVRDTGHGMSAITMDRIFEPFFTTKQLGEGTGLGLSVVHGIVLKHGGDIWVDSELGGGTTFTIFLPQVSEEMPAGCTDDTPVPTGSERVMFVDDEAEIVRMGSKMLVKLGYRVAAFTDSTEALAAFRIHPDEFDLVITDQNMPRVTGAMLAKELIRIRPDVPIILMTGFSEVVTAENFKHLGISEFLMKPLSARVLSNAIRGIMDPTHDSES
jgi:signal transduction histidine kinase/CheY-like chemotaxis protein